MKRPFLDAGTKDCLISGIIFVVWIISIFILYAALMQGQGKSY